MRPEETDEPIDDVPGEESEPERAEEDPDDEIVPVHRFQLRPIPPELFLSYQEEPPQKCLVCSTSLRDGRLFQIQKVYQGDEVVLEMTLCQNCCTSMSQEFSEESLERIREFLEQDPHACADDDHCHRCGAERAAFTGHTVVGVCQGGSLLMPVVVVCEACNLALEDRLSQKTRDIQKDFVRDHFPGVPADLDLAPSMGSVF